MMCTCITYILWVDNYVLSTHTTTVQVLQILQVLHVQVLLILWILQIDNYVFKRVNNFCAQCSEYVQKVPWCVQVLWILHVLWVDNYVFTSVHNISTESLDVWTVFWEQCIGITDIMGWQLCLQECPQLLCAMSRSLDCVMSTNPIMCSHVHVLQILLVLQVNNYAFTKKLQQLYRKSRCWECVNNTCMSRL